MGEKYRPPVTHHEAIRAGYYDLFTEMEEMDTGRGEKPVLKPSCDDDLSESHRQRSHRINKEPTLSSMRSEPLPTDLPSTSAQDSSPSFEITSDEWDKLLSLATLRNQDAGCGQTSSQDGFWEQVYSALATVTNWLNEFSEDYRYVNQELAKDKRKLKLTLSNSGLCKKLSERSTSASLDLVTIQAHPEGFPLAATGTMDNQAGR